MMRLCSPTAAAVGGQCGTDHLGKPFLPIAVIGLALAILALAPMPASAQSGIAGIVTDTSGGVLPGVTVEATSPALIEKVRTVVTGGQGRYNIVDLRPGVYVVSFSLAGFRTVRREGVSLPASFTATVNAELAVGELAETVSVTGETPVVDLRNTARQRTLSKEMLNSVPSGGTAQYSATLLLGVSQSTISFVTPPNTFRWSDLTFRGARESSISYDGFDTSHRLSGDGSQYMNNSEMSQEVVVSGGSAGAEALQGGVVVNVIPKTGSNQFSGSFATNFANSSFVSDNSTPQLEALGVTSQSIRRTWDFNPAFGGPILQDKLWFYTSYRNLGNGTDTGIRRDLDPFDWVYTPDLSRPTDTEQVKSRNYSLRLTWQASPRNSFGFNADHQPNDWQNRGGTTGGSRALNAPEATVIGNYAPNYISGLTWRSPVNNRVFLEAGVSITKNKQWFSRNFNDADTGEPVSPDLGLVGAQDLDNGWLFRGSHFVGNFNNTWGLRTRAAVSYITGNHTLKVGLQQVNGKDRFDRLRVGDYIVRVRSGVPVSLQVWGNEGRTSGLTSTGLFAQDQWVIKRATINLGMRYDYVAASADPEVRPANTILPEKSFEGADKLIHFHDLSPRFGVSYDLLGNNRTAVKASLNRYLGNQDFAGNRHPTAIAITNTTRDWTDANGNFLPDCDLTNPLLNGECGRIANLNFGSVNPNPTTFDPAVSGGFGNRQYSWEASTSIQHHVMQGLGVELGYYRRWWGNQTVTDNLRVSPEDYSPYCVRLPGDSRLENGGEEMCGFYNISSSKLGVVESFTTHAKNYGDEIQVYNGLEFSVNARLPNGVQLMGGTITERIRTESCYTIDSPEKVFCKNTPPFRTTLKLMGVAPLPGGIQVSGAYQMLPGPEHGATAVFGRSDIIGLGRPLSTNNVTLTIREPGSVTGPSAHKLDTRISKIVRVGKYRLTGSLDALSVLNGSAILAVNSRVGSSWLNPTTVQGGRLLRLSARFDF